MVPEFSPAEQDSLYTLRTHTPQKLNARPLHMGAGYPDLWGCAQGHFQSTSKAGLEALAVSWGPGWLLERWFLPRGQAQPSRKASVPGSQPPSHRLELRCKVTPIQNQAVRPALLPPQFPQGPGWAGLGGLPRKTGGEGERRAPGTYLAAAGAAIPRSLRGSMPARPSYSRRSATCATALQAGVHPQSQLPPFGAAGQRRAGRPRVGASREGFGCAGGPMPTLRYFLKSWGRLGRCEKSSRWPQDLPLGPRGKAAWDRVTVRGSSEPAGGGGAPTVRPEKPAPLDGGTRRLWAPGETRGWRERPGVLLAWKITPALMMVWRGWGKSGSHRSWRHRLYCIGDFLTGTCSPKICVLRQVPQGSVLFTSVSHIDSLVPCTKNFIFKIYF